MTLADRVTEYARAHLQPVYIVWTDEEDEIYDTMEAVELCSDRRESKRIKAVVAHDKKLEAMLNQLIGMNGGRCV